MLQEKVTKAHKLRAMLISCENQPEETTLEEAAIEAGVTMFLSSFGGHPHEGLATRVHGICDSVGIQLIVVDCMESPQLRKAILLWVRVFTQM